MRGAVANVIGLCVFLWVIGMFLPDIISGFVSSFNNGSDISESSVGGVPVFGWAVALLGILGICFCLLSVVRGFGYGLDDDDYDYVAPRYRYIHRCLYCGMSDDEVRKYTFYDNFKRYDEVSDCEVEVCGNCGGVVEIERVEV